MQGYILEGTIGNIATSRLTFTRELYRCIIHQKGAIFIRLIRMARIFRKKGYQFDGIAGYVRP